MKRMLTVMLLLALLLCAASCTPAPVPTEPSVPGSPADTAGAASAEEAAVSCFRFWRARSPEALLALTSPAWRAAQADPPAALEAICAGRIPTGEAEVLSIGGTPDDRMRSVRASVPLRTGDSQPETYVFTVIVLQADGRWYVDPQSVAFGPARPTAAPVDPVP